MNFAKIILSEPAKRNSGSSFLSAAAQTISEGGMPGRIVRSQEPKQLHTSVGNEQERYCKVPWATMPAWTKRW